MASKDRDNFEDISEDELESIYDSAQPFASDELMYAAIEQLNRIFAIERPNIRKADEVSKRNPYHDSRGRFTSGSRAVTASGGRSGGSGGKKVSLSRVRSANASAKTASAARRAATGGRSGGSGGFANGDYGTGHVASTIMNGISAVKRFQKKAKMKSGAEAAEKMLKDYDKMETRHRKLNDPAPDDAAFSEFYEKYGSTPLEVENAVDFLTN